MNNQDRQEVAQDKSSFLYVKESIIENGTSAFLWFAPLYYLVHPEDLSILIVDYLKIHPSVVVLMIQNAVPAIAGVFVGYFLIRVVVLIFIIFFILSFIIFLVLVGFNSLIKLVSKKSVPYINLDTFNKLDKIFPNADKFGTYISNIQFFLAAFFVIVFIFLTIAEKSIWSSKANPAIALAAEKHYYCQVTGSYNQSKCKEIITKK